MRGLLVLLAVVAVVVGLAPLAAADTLPPTLTGEFFAGSPVETVTANCAPTGTSTITFYSTGTAVGPYPGTYTESGTATIGAETLPIFVNGFEAGPLLTFKAFFTIDSAVGQVTGTKTLAAPAGGAYGLCYDFSDRDIGGGSGPVITGTLRQICACGGQFAIPYDATIKTSAGFFGDSGGADVLLNEFKYTSPTVPPHEESTFNEAFRSSGTTVSPLPSGGHVTGGGKVGTDVIFGLTAKSDSSGTKGECTVIDRATSTMVKCIDATTVIQTATHATIFGTALVNGTSTSYRIDVDDLAEPGQGADTFAIHTTSGYAAGGGTLTQGNIQLH